MSYGIDWKGVDRGLAVYTARVLGGTKPSELPFEQPSRYELVLNLQTADDLGLTFPDSLMAFADDMVEEPLALCRSMSSDHEGQEPLHSAVKTAWTVSDC